MKKHLLFITFMLLLVSCNVYKKNKFSYRNEDKNVWINTFKAEVFYSCINEGIGNDSVIKVLKHKDLFNMYDGFPLNEIDNARSIGKKVIFNISKPYIKIDEDENNLKNKNFISMSCLNYYASRELDSIAKKAYKVHLKNVKKNEGFWKNYEPEK